MRCLYGTSSYFPSPGGFYLFVRIGYVPGSISIYQLTFTRTFNSFMYLRILCCYSNFNVYIPRYLDDSSSCFYLISYPAHPCSILISIPPDTHLIPALSSSSHRTPSSFPRPSPSLSPLPKPPIPKYLTTSQQRHISRGMRSM